MIKTTQDLIKVLPFEKKFKEKLLESYEGLDPDRKFNIWSMLWETYFALYDLKLEENISIALDEARENREKLDGNFYERVRELTDREMVHISAEDIKSADMSAAREKLAEIVASVPPAKVSEVSNVPKVSKVD